MNWKETLEHLVQRQEEDLYPLFVYKFSKPAKNANIQKDTKLYSFYQRCNEGFISEYNFLSIDEMMNKEKWEQYTQGLFEQNNPILDKHNYVFAAYFENLVIWNSESDTVSILYLDSPNLENKNKTFEQFMDDIFNKELFEDDDLWKQALNQI